MDWTADSGSHGGPASGAAAAPVPDRAPPAVADWESLLWRNNALQILSNGAWYVAIPFIPLYLAAQGASIGVIGTIIGFSGVAPLLISLHAGALVDERGPAVVAKASVLLFALAGGDPDGAACRLGDGRRLYAHGCREYQFRRRAAGSGGGGQHPRDTGSPAIMFISFVVACGQTLQQSFYSSPNR